MRKSISEGKEGNRIAEGFAPQKHPELFWGEIPDRNGRLSQDYRHQVSEMSSLLIRTDLKDLFDLHVRSGPDTLASLYEYIVVQDSFALVQ